MPYQVTLIDWQKSTVWAQHTYVAVGQESDLVSRVFAV